MGILPRNGAAANWEISPGNGVPDARSRRCQTVCRLPYGHRRPILIPLADSLYWPAETTYGRTKN